MYLVHEMSYTKIWNISQRGTPYDTSYSAMFLVWQYRALYDYRVKLYMNEFQMSSINIHLPQSIKRKR